MEITNVELVKDDKTTALKFEKSTPKPEIGSQLLVHLNSSQPANSIFYVKVTYKTTKDAKALHWLDPNDTTGKQKGYLFT
jgi:hypothetical protein